MVVSDNVAAALYAKTLSDVRVNLSGNQSANLHEPAPQCIGLMGIVFSSSQLSTTDSKASLSTNAASVFLFKISINDSCR